MKTQQNNEPHLLFAERKSRTRDEILRLHQTLQRMQAEILAKLAVLDAQGSSKQRIQKQQLFLLTSEVERALQTIDGLVALVGSPKFCKEPANLLEEEGLK